MKSNLNELDDWQKEAKKTFEGDYWYESPPDTLASSNDLLKNLKVVLLIGNNTASAAEDFLIAAESIALGQTVGENTFGSTGQPMFMRLPGGGSARICTKRDMYPDGKEFVGYGIKPDIVVEASIQDFIAGTDKAMEVAIKTLQF
ncbi:MAG: S41 family peptidase [Bacteroidota bacterium]